MYSKIKKIGITLSKVSFITLLSGVMLFFILNYFFPFHITTSYSSLILDKKGEIVYGFLSKDDKWRFYTELEEISPLLKKTILYKEDRWFYYHFGINPFAVGRAAAKNIWTGRRTSGASTITMQVVRLLEPKKRTYFNKLIETFRAFQLEWNYSKDQILQLYLNLIPYGSNVEGVKSASLLYFGQTPEKLSLAQLTALTIVPNRPTSLSFSRASEEKIVKERNKWLSYFQKDKLFEETIIADALDEPLSISFRKMSREAPHFSLFLKQKYTDKKTLYTTLDRTFQQKTQQITYNYVRRLAKIGVYNAAVLVVDNRNKEVLAYLGSNDFEDKAHAGQVDGVQAFRSPGSTLKPLIYGMAFDKGLLTPKRKLLDIPVNYDGYTPENFDKNFNGEVSVEVALSYSLNIPAVNTLNELGVSEMINMLKAANFKQITTDQHKLGLSLALGGCGVSLQELVGLYSAFATNGKWQELVFLKPNLVTTDENTIHSQTLLSPSASYMLSEILTQVQRPDFPSDYQNSKNVPKISWKTGTSYGRRDAWSIGYNAHYTIGVWLGNFSGEGSEYLTGADIATPLLFKLFTSLDYAATNEELEKPQELQKRLVCSHTGKVPSSFCQSLVQDFYIPTISKSDACTHLKKVFVSKDELFSYCSFCLPTDGDTTTYKTAYFPNLESTLSAYYTSQNYPVQSIPPHNPTCTHIFKDDDVPRITSLFQDKIYYVEDDSTQLLLACQVAPDISKVIWYINDEFFQETDPKTQVFFTPQKGKIKISCTDNKGRNSDIWIRVR